MKTIEDLLRQPLEKDADAQTIMNRFNGVYDIFEMGAIIKKIKETSIPLDIIHEGVGGEKYALQACNMENRLMVFSMDRPL